MKKKFLLGLMLASSCAGLAACGSTGNGGSTQAPRKIAVGLYTLTGNFKDGVTSFLDSLKKDHNFEYTIFETGFDSASLLKAAEKEIAGGAEGIITTMDGGKELLDLCKDANISYAGFACDFETSYEQVKNDPAFLGNICDGRYQGFAWGQHIAERIIKEGKKNIGMIKFPAFAYPHQAEMDKAFREKIAEFNKTAAEADKIKVQEQTTEMPFFGFDTQAFIGANPGMDAIYAMCGGVDSIYPNMTDAQKKSISLYTAGYNSTLTSAKDFGEGNCIQEMVFSTSETIAYPLAMLLNKFDGKTYSDQPAIGQRVESSQIIIQTKEDLDFVQQHSIYHTFKASDSFLTSEEFGALLAKNGGTHEKLVKAVNSMSLADLRARNK